MNKIPIGNTLQVRWRVKHNGQAESLEGLDLSLVMTTPSGQKQAMAFAVSDTNLVTVNYEGKDQQHLGNYRLDLFENRGENNQRRIDSTPAFILVAHTAESHRESDPSLEVYTVDLTGDIEIDYPSTAVLFTPQELTAGQQAQARENIGVEDEIFVAEYGVTTFAEVKAAYEAGTTIICKRGSFYEPLVSALLNTFTFCALLNKTRLLSSLNANGWVEIDAETLATAADLAGKQDTISDLASIRSGASAGATALQPSDLPTFGNIVTHDADEFLPSSTEIPSKTSDLINDSVFIGDAPSGGEQYARKAGEWVKVQGGFYYNEII